MGGAGPVRGRAPRRFPITSGGAVMPRIYVYFAGSFLVAAVSVATVVLAAPVAGPIHVDVIKWHRVFRIHWLRRLAAGGHEPDYGNDGCGTAPVQVPKAILGNPDMIKANTTAFRQMAKPVPDGAMMAKIEWLKTTDEAAPYPNHGTGTNRSGLHGERLQTVQGHERMGIRHARSTTRRRTRISRTPARASPRSQGRATPATPPARRPPTSSTPASQGGDRSRR